VIILVPCELSDLYNLVGSYIIVFKYFGCWVILLFPHHTKRKRNLKIMFFTAAYGKEHLFFL